MPYTLTFGFRNKRVLGDGEESGDRLGRVRTATQEGGAEGGDAEAPARTRELMGFAVI